jgi:hypothetical protein
MKEEGGGQQENRREIGVERSGFKWLKIRKSRAVVSTVMNLQVS